VDPKAKGKGSNGHQNVFPMVEDKLQQESAFGQSNTFIPYHQRFLFKPLLHVIARRTYAPNNARFHKLEENALHVYLCIIFNPQKTHFHYP
jgi:hypothetical protein